MNKDYDFDGLSNELLQKYDLQAKKDGEYYLCLLGVHSDSTSIKKGRLYVDWIQKLQQQFEYLYWKKNKKYEHFCWLIKTRNDAMMIIQKD